MFSKIKSYIPDTKVERRLFLLCLFLYIAIIIMAFIKPDTPTDYIIIAITAYLSSLWYIRHFNKAFLTGILSVVFVLPIAYLLKDHVWIYSTYVIAYFISPIILYYARKNFDNNYKPYAWLLP